MDEEIKETGEMATIEGEEDIAIEEDYTALEAETVIIDDDSNIQTEAEYEQAVGQKELADEAREALSAVLLSVLEKGEINDDDIAEIAAQQEIYTENVTALKILGLTTEDEKSTAGKSTTNVITSNIDYDELMKVLSEKADWLYTDEDGQVMLNGEVVPKIKVIELEAEKVKADVGEFKDLTTENFTAVNAKIDNLKVTDLTAINAEIENLKANKADITELNATNATIENLKANKADINELNAAVGNITILQSDVATINTLINGHLTSDNIQSLVLTSDKVTVEDAFIKDAMIETVNASKINTGVINTNNVSIQSDDGSMLLQGNLQQFKDKNGKVRIQIGKDAKGDFTFVLYGEDGKGQLINQNGIQSSDAIADGLIVDAKVAENANINAGKLDISSLFSEINGASETIKGTKIYLDNEAQTLDVAFKQMKTSVNNVTGDINNLQEQMETNITKIGVAQGEISTLIANTTITKEDGTVIQLKDAYNSTKDTVNSHATKIGALETNYDKVTGDIASVNSKQSILEQNLDRFKTTVSNTYQTKEDMTNYASKDSVDTLSNNLIKNYSTTSQMLSAIDQKANQITMTVSNTYATKHAVEDLNENLTTNYSTTQQMNSAINQKADSIISTVSSTYATTQSTSTLLKESITEYYLSTSNTTLSGGAWGTTPYIPTPGKYIWQRTKSVTNAGDIKYSNPICVSDEAYSVMITSDVLLLKCDSDGRVV